MTVQGVYSSTFERMKVLSMIRFRKGRSWIAR
jgi:hypothetical protein